MFIVLESCLKNDLSDFSQFVAVSRASPIGPATRCPSVPVFQAVDIG